MSNTMLSPSPLLRAGLVGDAAASAAMGALLALGAGALAGPLGYPEALLRGVGLVLLPCAAWVGWMGTRAAVSRLAVRALVALNLVWVADSVLLVALGPTLFGLAPTGLGVAFVLAQGGAVLGFAAMQAAGLRRASGAAPAFV